VQVWQRYRQARRKRSAQPLDLRADRLRVELATKLAWQALRRRRPLIWTNVWAPTELLYALDCVPASLEVYAAMLASIEMTPCLCEVAEREGYGRDSCSLLRSALGAVLAGLFPPPQAVVCTSHLCDTGTKALYAASVLAEAPFFLLEVPHQQSAEAEGFLAEQLRELAASLAALLDRPFREERLREALHLSNQARAWLQKANELRRAIPAPMLGRSSLDYFYLMTMAFGHPETVTVYRTLYEELEGRVRKGFSPLGKERARILWLHQVRPYFPNNLLHHLEQELRVVVAFDEMGYVFWEELDPTDPFRSLARKLMANHCLGPIERRVEAVLRMCREYRVDGAVHFSQWGCRHSTGGIRFLKEALQKEGLPLLSLDGDAADASQFSEGQIRTRLEAFVEVLL